jgi:hypothetical protein
VKSNHSPSAAPTKQDSLIFFRRVDFQDRDVEIDRPIVSLVGSRDLMEQLAPRDNAKAP